MVALACNLSTWRSGAGRLPQDRQTDTHTHRQTHTYTHVQVFPVVFYSMRVLTLLTTFLLLALHTQAESLQGSNAKVVKEDQDISIFFGGGKSTSIQNANERNHHA